jgi:hypothetical protein
MSEHSVEELERQVKAAEDRHRQASLDVHAARQRLQDARNAESGIIGHVLQFDRSQGYGRKARTITRRILVDAVRPMSGGRYRAYGKIIVANGSVGVRRDDIEAHEATDLGPYQATA